MNFRIEKLIDIDDFDCKWEDTKLGTCSHRYIAEAMIATLGYRGDYRIVPVLEEHEREIVNSLPDAGQLVNRLRTCSVDDIEALAAGNRYGALLDAMGVLNSYGHLPCSAELFAEAIHRGGGSSGERAMVRVALAIFRAGDQACTYSFLDDLLELDDRLRALALAALRNLS